MRVFPRGCDRNWQPGIVQRNRFADLQQPSRFRLSLEDAVLLCLEQIAAAIAFRT